MNLWAVPTVPTRIWGLGFVSSLLLCASGSPALKWGHWSRSSRRCHLALIIYEDDASFLLRGYCTDKSSHRAWHRMKRHTCNQKLFHLPWKEPEKDKNKQIHLPPPRIFKYSYSLAFCSFVLHWVFIFTTSASYLLFVGGGPSSLSSLFQVSFLSLHPIFPFFPIHLISMPSLKRHSSFPHDVELKVVSRSRDGGPITEGWYVRRREKWWIRAGGTTGVKENKQSVGVAALYNTSQRLGQSWLGKH